MAFDPNKFNDGNKDKDTPVGEAVNHTGRVRDPKDQERPLPPEKGGLPITEGTESIRAPQDVYSGFIGNEPDEDERRRFNAKNEPSDRELELEAKLKKRTLSRRVMAGMAIATGAVIAGSSIVVGILVNKSDSSEGGSLPPDPKVNATAPVGPGEVEGAPEEGPSIYETAKVGPEILESYVMDRDFVILGKDGESGAEYIQSVLSDNGSALNPIVTYGEGKTLAPKEGEGELGDKKTDGLDQFEHNLTDYVNLLMANKDLLEYDESLLVYNGKPVKEEPTSRSVRQKGAAFVVAGFGEITPDSPEVSDPSINPTTAMINRLVHDLDDGTAITSSTITKIDDAYIERGDFSTGTFVRFEMLKADGSTDTLDTKLSPMAFGAYEDVFTADHVDKANNPDNMGYAALWPAQLKDFPTFRSMLANYELGRNMNDLDEGPALLPGKK